MKCWEYRTVTADSSSGLLPALNKLGDVLHRWRLVDITVEIVEDELPRYVAMLEREYDPYDGGPYIP